MKIIKNIELSKNLPMERNKENKNKADKRREILLMRNNEEISLGHSSFEFKLEGTQEYKKLMTFHPNFTALFLNISDKNFQASKQIYEDIIIPNLIDKGNYCELECENSESIFYDFYEAILISIFFAYNAVECLVNNLIPNYSVVFSKTKENECILKSKNCIERFVGLEEKVKNILPKIYGYAFNPGKIKCWSDFKTLIKYRNEIAHFKSFEYDDYKNNQIDFINKMIVNVITMDIVESARKLIQYLNSKINNVPGFPSEFSKEKLNLDDYLKHYGKKIVEKDKSLVFEFKDESSLNEFMTQTKIQNGVPFSIYFK